MKMDIEGAEIRRARRRCGKRHFRNIPRPFIIEVNSTELLNDLQTSTNRILIQILETSRVPEISITTTAKSKDTEIAFEQVGRIRDCKYNTQYAGNCQKND